MTSAVSALCDKQMKNLPHQLIQLKLAEPKQVHTNKVVNELLSVFGKMNDTFFKEYFDNDSNKYCTYNLHKLNKNHHEYRSASSDFEYYGTKVATRIGNYWKNSKMSIVRIKKVVNPYLTAHFELKKKKKIKLYSRCYVEDLFHGTEACNVASILEENFDWRLFGTNVGYRFGQGVSFSPKAGYASDYPREYTPGEERCMILTQVLICYEAYGSENMIVPPKGYDTSTREDELVKVKYEDADYNPQYVIYYTK